MGRVKDLTGKRFGRLVVLSQAPYRPGRSNAIWHCQCDCGSVKDVAGCEFDSVQSCGCLRKEVIAERNRTRRLDLTGAVQGLLTYIEEYPCDKPDRFIKCFCACGNTVILSAPNFTSGHSKSCGCIQRSAASNRLKSYHANLQGFTDNCRESIIRHNSKHKE